MVGGTASISKGDLEEYKARLDDMNPAVFFRVTTEVPRTTNTDTENSEV